MGWRTPCRTAQSCPSRHPTPHGPPPACTRRADASVGVLRRCARAGRDGWTESGGGAVRREGVGGGERARGGRDTTRVLTVGQEGGRERASEEAERLWPTRPGLCGWMCAADAGGWDGLSSERLQYSLVLNKQAGCWDIAGEPPCHPCIVIVRALRYARKRTGTRAHAYHRARWQRAGNAQMHPPAAVAALAISTPYPLGKGARQRTRLHPTRAPAVADIPTHRPSVPVP